MQHPQFSPFPHLTWLGSWVAVGGRVATVEFQQRQVNHWVIYNHRASAEVRWTHCGHEERFTVDAGSVRFCPADDELHTTIGRCQPGHEFYALVIPRHHLLNVAEAEGLDAVPDLRHSVSRRDAVLTNSMRRLANVGNAHASPWPEDQEAAALALILRLLTKNGWLGPDWKNDTSVFSRATLGSFVDHIDAELRHGVSLSDLSLMVGMSPSHFAKKFRQSTGLSLHRFVHYRRIRRSLALLQEGTVSLPAVAVELGFSSHSHFTRTFGAVVGMTPDQYRAQFKRVIG